MSPNIIYRGRIIHAKGYSDVEDIPDGMLAVDGSGKVIACGAFDESFKGEVVDLSSRLIIPGLVDVHSHIPQLDVRGKHGATLLDWLERYIFPAERAFADPKIAQDVTRRFFKKMILNGTTCAGLYSTVHEDATNRCFEIAKAAGVRCFIGKVMMDQHSPDGLLETTKESLERSERLCSKWHGAEGGRLQYAYSPRFAPTCSLELWQETGKLAKESGAYIQSHIAETKRENKKVKELHPQFRDYVALFEETGTLGPKTVLAHAIYLSEYEFERLAKAGAKIAHCATSNFFLKSGQMNVATALKTNADFALGTDVGAGTSMSVFTEMRHADYTQLETTVTPTNSFYLATLGGAKVMSMDDKIGNFEKGKIADFCVLDIYGIDPRYVMREMDTDEILSLLMYRGDGRVIESVYVGGRELDVDGF